MFYCLERPRLNQQKQLTGKSVLSDRCENVPASEAVRRRKTGHVRLCFVSVTSYFAKLESPKPYKAEIEPSHRDVIKSMGVLEKADPLASEQKGSALKAGVREMNTHKVYCAGILLSLRCAVTLVGALFPKQ